MKSVQKNWLEWSVFAASLVIILTIVTYLVYDVTTMGDSPPIVEVRLGAAEPRNGSYVVPVTLHNSGDQTAETVTVEVLLLDDGAEIETAEVTIDFLPRQSTRSGWVTFTTDPATADEIQSHVLGYQEP